MSTRHVASFHLPGCVAFALAALATGTALAQDVSINVDCVPRMTGLQQRLYQKANEGPDVLRAFMFIRRGILQLDTYETAAWANSVNEARTVCMKKSARAEASPSAAT
jgi:hypothetical protein